MLLSITLDKHIQHCPNAETMLSLSLIQLLVTWLVLIIWERVHAQIANLQPLLISLSQARVTLVGKEDVVISYVLVKITIWFMITLEVSYLLQGSWLLITVKSVIIQSDALMCLKSMAITVIDKILVSSNMKVLPLISILELCGQFICNTKEEHGEVKQTDGENGSGKVTNHWTRD